MKYRYEKADCILETDFGPRLVWRRNDSWNAKRVPQEERFAAVRIGEHKPKDSGVLVEATVSILLDSFPSAAKEYHVVRFTPDDWDYLVEGLRLNRGYTLTFKNATIAYDERGEKAIVDMVEHVDFGGPDGGISGSDFGVYKEYVKGWMRSCDAIVQTYVFDFVERKNPFELPTSFIGFEELLRNHARAQRKTVIVTDCFGDSYEEMPSLSDFYDDMQELELNTRGDGYDSMDPYDGGEIADCDTMCEAGDDDGLPPAHKQVKGADDETYLDDLP